MGASSIGISSPNTIPKAIAFFANVVLAHLIFRLECGPNQPKMLGGPRLRVKHQHHRRFEVHELILPTVLPTIREFKYVAAQARTGRLVIECHPPRSSIWTNLTPCLHVQYKRPQDAFFGRFAMAEHQCHHQPNRVPRSHGAKVKQPVGVKKESPFQNSPVRY